MSYPIVRQTAFNPKQFQCSKNWKKTESTGKKITQKMREDRAKAIAGILSDSSKWQSHGRHISLSTLMEDDIKLKINNCSVREVEPPINDYCGFTVDYYTNWGITDYIHSEFGTMEVKTND